MNPENSTLFRLDAKRKQVIAPNDREYALRKMPPTLDSAAQAILAEPAAVWYGEHWDQARSSSPYSLPLLLENLPETLGNLRFAVPFNLFESGAATEDHDRYRTLSDFYRAELTEGRRDRFDLFLMRPTAALTEWHLFELRDFPLGDAEHAIATISPLSTLLTGLEASADFPSDAPRWTQTYFRRKREILGLEHWTHLYRERIAVDLEQHASDFPAGYREAWLELGRAITDLYRVEAAERNHRFKETLFSYAPEAHATPGFDSILSHTARAFFPGAHFVLEDPDRIGHFSETLGQPAFTLDVAERILEGTEEFRERYAEYLEQSRTIGAPGTSGTA